MATVLVPPAAVHGSGVAVSTDEEYPAFFNLLHKVSVVQSCVITATTICGWEHCERERRSNEEHLSADTSCFHSIERSGLVAGCEWPSLAWNSTRTDQLGW